MNTTLPAFIDETALAQMKTYVDYLKKSDALPKGIKNEGQCVMILNAGREMGLNSTQSLTGITMINGVITVRGTVAELMMRKAEYDREFFEKDNEKRTEVARIRIRKGPKDAPVRGPLEERYTIEEAKLAGLLDKDGGSRHKHPVDMLRHKVLARVRKYFCPEVLDGVPMTEDYMGQMGDSKVIDATDTKKSLSDLIDEAQTIEQLLEIKEDVVATKDRKIIMKYTDKQKAIREGNIVEVSSQESPQIIIDTETIDDNAHDTTFDEAVESIGKSEASKLNNSQQSEAEEDEDLKKDLAELNEIIKDPEDADSQEDEGQVILTEAEQLDGKIEELTKKMKTLDQGDPEYQDLREERADLLKKKKNAKA